MLLQTALIAQTGNNAAASANPDKAVGNAADEKMEVATFGGGCFWCLEAVFEQVKGVKDVISGYEGDDRIRYQNPSYQLVCSKRTQHAEVCQITFDPSVVSYKELLEIFWKTHNPTTKNRQGPDVGPQYRSIIFANSDEQLKEAEKYKKMLNDENAFGERKTVVTEIEPTVEFYRAEEYHQDYFAKHPNDVYCNMNARPKVEKLRAVFGDKVKK